MKLGNENANSSLHMAERTGTGRNTSDNRDSSTAPAAPKAKRGRVAAKLAKSAQVVAKHTAPQAPERKEREAGSPPPQASKKNKNQKRSRGQNLKRGLWLRQPSSDNIEPCENSCSTVSTSQMFTRMLFSRRLLCSRHNADQGTVSTTTTRRRA